jgi:xylulokinase
VAEDGTPVEDALLWLDDREQRIDGAPSFFLPKIRWLADHRPDVCDAAWRIMTCPEYLVFLAGGDPHSTSPSAEFDPVVWDATGAADYGIDLQKLPPLVRPGAPVGTTSEGATELMGIPAGVPIFAGGPDFLVSLLGTGVVRPGLTCDRAGTSEGINHCLDHPATGAGVRTLPHVVPGLWNIAGVLSSTGRMFEWFRRISRQSAVDYEQMLAEIEESGFEDEPYFFPSTHQGAAWEFSGGMFSGLRSTHGTAEMGRGVVHAIGYAVRQSVEALGAVGCDIVERRACGGQAKNPVWLQMKADITGVPIATPDVLDAELVGNVCCALSGMGEFGSPWEAADRLVRMTSRYLPRPERTERYVLGFERYLRIHSRFVEAFAQTRDQVGGEFE